MFIGRYSDQLWVLFNGVAAYFDFVMFIGMLGVMLGLTTVLPLRKMSLGHSSSVSSLAMGKTPSDGCPMASCQVPLKAI